MSEQVKLDSESITSFMLAGKATFTIHNPRTSRSFTYKVKANKEHTVHFVSILTGPDNNSNYTYIGFIRNNEFVYGRNKSPIGNDAPSVLAFSWLMANRSNLGPVECFRSSKCARCGRKLTRVSSIIQWLGEDCAKMVALNA